MTSVQTGKTIIRFRENRHLLVKETYDEVKTLLTGDAKIVEVTVQNEQTTWKSPLPNDTKANKVVKEHKVLINVDHVDVAGPADALQADKEF